MKISEAFDLYKTEFLFIKGLSERVLQDNDILVGMGSACSSRKAGNRILESMGKKKEDVKSHIRISLDEENTVREIEFAANKIVEVYNEIWEKVK